MVSKNSGTISNNEEVYYKVGPSMSGYSIYTLMKSV